MKVLTRGPAFRSDRAATELLHDHANARIVAFALAAGQTVPAHQSDSSVVVIVIEGGGVFRGEDGEATLEVGDGAVYAPGEVHAIEAGERPLRFLAIITPRPA